jgi:DNA-binding CsgD family transcriptional regulator/energy-coupling factor transporter ATP-binding protein EcfA2
MSALPSFQATAILERDNEIALFDQCIQRVSFGRGTIVFVSGEAGIGKTTLLRNLAAMIPHNWSVHWGSNDDLNTPRPLSPLLDVAKDLGLSEQALLHTKITDRQSEIYGAFLQALRQRRLPTLLMFEDMHWADSSTCDLVRFVGRRMADLPVLWVLSFRDDELSQNHPLRRVIADLPSNDTIRMPLAALSTKAVHSMLQGTSLRDELAAIELHELTAGNPFFVTELLAARGASAVYPNVEQSTLPLTVRDAVLGRAQRLSESARELLNLACLEPNRVEIDLLAKLNDRAIGDLLTECLQVGVLRLGADSTTVQFRHEIARRAIESALPLPFRTQLHQQYAQLISEVQPAHLARKVYHAKHAGLGELVLEWAPRAAEQAARLGAHQQAADHYKSCLAFTDLVDLAQKAHLHESWSYETGIAQVINQEVIESQQIALQIRRQLGHVREIGINLRWLSRFHWYLGQAEQATRYAEEAIEVLEGSGAPRELAMAYSVRSQLYMLADHTEQAIEWGNRAIALAQTVGDIETRIHALNNVGTAQLFAHRPEGKEKLETSLALALEHGFHEHAARVYTNMSEYMVTYYHFDEAEKYLQEGIRFDNDHDLDSWTHYLVGWLAFLRCEQGRYDEAESIAQSVLERKNLTALMRLPALTVLGMVRMRQGHSDGNSLLMQAWSIAEPLGEPQRTVTLQCALCEADWLKGDLSAALAHLEIAKASFGQGTNIYQRGEIDLWLKRCGQERLSDENQAPVFRQEIQATPANEFAQVGQEWARLGAPYRQALALAHGDLTEMNQAIEILTKLGAKTAQEWVRQRANQLGLKGVRRGPYKVSQENSFGLTAKEQAVLDLMLQGHSNQDIAKALFRSVRTIEHHVEQIVSKLKARNRAHAISIGAGVGGRISS